MGPPLRVALVAVLTLSVAGCGWFGGDKASGSTVAVYDIKPGQCFTAPGAVKTELASLNRVSCSDPHTHEAYAIVQYSTSTAGSASATTSVYPTSDALTNFAQGSCAQKFQDYVGINYLDSSLYFTFLVPSARGWEQDNDRSIICFITTTGQTLTTSVQGSKK
ncbi:putative regulator of septum formation [Jatrophihabitans sp. GAS493]|nr:putative regulator of septum formation [Jatrophihabitans sp. GAS493]